MGKRLGSKVLPLTSQPGPHRRPYLFPAAPYVTHGLSKAKVTCPRSPGRTGSRSPGSTAISVASSTLPDGETEAQGQKVIFSKATDLPGQVLALRCVLVPAPTTRHRGQVSMQEPRQPPLNTLHSSRHLLLSLTKVQVACKCPNMLAVISCGTVQSSLGGWGETDHIYSILLTKKTRRFSVGR